MPSVIRSATIKVGQDVREGFEMSQGTVTHIQMHVDVLKQIRDMMQDQYQRDELTNDEIRLLQYVEEIARAAGIPDN